MKLIRNLVFPWILFFMLAVAGLVLIGIKFTRIQLTIPQLYFTLTAGAVLCFMSNVSSLGNVGIWMSEALPESLRYSSWRWIMRAIKAAIIGAAIWFIGTLPWIPLIWQAAVVPAVFTILLFVIVWSLMGPILKFSSNMAWSRAFSVILSAPILLLVPVTALFLGQSMVQAYRSSRAELLPEPVAVESFFDMKSKAGDSSSSKKTSRGKAPMGKSETLAAAPPAPPKLERRAQVMKDIAESPGSCAEHDKLIMANLEPKASDDNVLWATRAVHCSNITAVAALGRLAQVMVENPSAQIRASAILAMKKFGPESIKQISYLLVKRLSDREPPEVVEAAATVLFPLGAEEQKWAVKRLKGLLDNSQNGFAAAKALVTPYNHQDIIAEYVTQNLGKPGEARTRAISMICLLPPDKRIVAEEHISNLVETITTADKNDPSMKALSCLGRPGFLAIREELSHPTHLDRTKAAQVLAEMNVKDMPEAIETADACARDTNGQVRQLCSRSLGEIGAPALSKILELLKSGDVGLKESGQNALKFFDDVTAKEELMKIRADNSGWMANNKKLQIAKAVSLALLKMQDPVGPPLPPELMTTKNAPGRRESKQ